MTRSPYAPASMTLWTLAGLVKVPGGFWANNLDLSLTIFDNNATPKSIVQMGFWRYINTPDGSHATLSVSFGVAAGTFGTVGDTTVFTNHYQNDWPRYDSWQPFSITATASGLTCSAGNKPPIVVQPGTGSSWNCPASLQFGFGTTDGLYLGSLKFGDY